MAKRIAVAGATGNLGVRIVKALLSQGGEVIALVRKGSDAEKVKALTGKAASRPNRAPRWTAALIEAVTDRVLHEIRHRSTAV